MSQQPYTEIEGVEVNNVQNFPYSGMKAVGGIQIGLGLICIILGLADVVLYIFQDSDFELPTVTPPTAANKATHEAALDVLKLLRTLTLTSAPIWCGLWYIVAGAMSICMSEHRKSTLYYIKITFLVLSILCATVFGPICLGISGFAAIIRHTMSPGELRWLIPLLSAFFALNEIAIAIVSAAICCCCSAVRTSKVKLLVTQPSDGGNGYTSRARERSRDSAELFTTTDRYGKALPFQRPDTGDTFVALKRLALPSTNVRDREF